MKDLEKTIITKEEFEKKLLAEDYDFSNRIFEFDVGEVFRKIYKEENSKEWEFDDDEVDRPIYTFVNDKDVNFSRAIFNYETSFGSVHFEGNVNYMSTYFERNIDFNNTLFKESTGFLQARFASSTEFNFTYFSKKVNFMFVNFEGETNFRFTHFIDASVFIGATFKGVTNYVSTDFGGVANFINVQFDGVTNFWKSKFKDITSFRGANFQGKIDFVDIQLIDKTIIFDNAVFSSVAVFDDINKKAKKEEHKGALQFHNVTFKENASFHNARLHSIDIKYTLIEKQIHLISSDVTKPNREYYRIIKHQLLIQNNKIEALEYLSKEMDVYRKDTCKLIKIGSFKEKVSNLLTYALLGLNKISNNSGLSSSIALVFTLLVGAYMFILSLLCSGEYTFEWGCNTDNWTNYLKFLVPTHKLEYLDTKEILLSSKFGFVFFDLFGRILVAYGIYQFIRAFRRYKSS